MIRRVSIAVVSVCALLFMTGAGAESSMEKTGDRLARMVKEAPVNLFFRYRYEFVDEDGFDKDAHASTLRGRLNFAPQLNEDWSFLAEIDYVQYIGNDTFNNTRNGKTDRPLVADPDGADLNQILVRYSGFDNTLLTFGRQRINRDGQRYIGGVGWRQNEQTFDSISVAYGGDGPFQAFYSYVFQVNRIFGPEKGTPARQLDSNTHLLDASYRFNDAIKLGGYVYLIDLDDADNFSNSTVGLRVSGAVPVTGEFGLGYLGEFARQEDYGDNPVSYDANYYRFEGRANWRQFAAVVGKETLEGGDVMGSGFRTPLATLHKFQGWADRFVGVSSTGSQAGIEDFYVGMTAKLLGGQFLVRYHDFDAETGGGSLGSEWDASANWSFAKRYGLLLKFASYDADNFSSDATHVWTQMTAKF